MAEAYATFAARGKHCNSIAILEVTDPAGNRLPVPQADCKQVLDQKIADGVNELLQGVIERGTGTAGRHRPAGGGQDRHHQLRASRSGSSATRPTSPPPSGPATPARRQGGYPLRTVVIGGATTATSAVAACPDRSGSR